MFYLRMQDQWYTFNMFDAQAWYVRDIIMGRIALPDAAAMEADVVAWQKAEEALEDDYACIRYQGAYTGELIDETDYPTFNIEAANQAFIEWKGHKKKGIMTFRDLYTYTSEHSPRNTTQSRVEALDDSLESYLQE